MQLYHLVTFVFYAENKRSELDGTSVADEFANPGKIFLLCPTYFLRGMKFFFSLVMIADGKAGYLE